jgi:hypothetical protein
VFVRRETVREKKSTKTAHETAKKTLRRRQGRFHKSEPNVVGAEQRELERHSFIVKIWLEEAEDESGLAKWRGHIAHVGTQKKCYVETLTGISSFIRGYLLGMGARLSGTDQEGQ